MRSKLENKKCNGILLLLTGAMLLFACNDNSTESYDTAIRNGLDALIAEDYDRAEVFFELAQEEEQNGKEASLLLEQTQAFHQAIMYFERAEIEDALERSVTAVSIESMSEGLNLRAQELVDVIRNLQLAMETYELAYETALDEFEKGDNEGALVYLQEVIENKDQHAFFFEDVFNSAEELIAKIEEQTDQIETVEAVEKSTPNQQDEEKGGEENPEVTTAESSEEPSLDNYSAKEIEYARILLMTNLVDPDSSTIYVGDYPAGTPVAQGYEETVTFPMATTSLVGEYGYMGSITYSSHGDGHITIYPVPSHWHQEDQSAEGYRAYAQSILNDAVKVYVDPGDPREVINKIERTNFENY